MGLHGGLHGASRKADARADARADWAENVPRKETDGGVPRGRTSRREQVDQIKNYRILGIRRYSQYADTMEVARVRDDKKFVIKFVEKHLVQDVADVKQALNTLLRFYSELRRRRRRSGHARPAIEVEIAYPDKIFEDVEYMYFVFAHYDVIDGGETLSAETRARIRTSLDVAQTGADVVNWECVELGHMSEGDGHRLVAVVDLGGVAEVERDVARPRPVAVPARAQVAPEPVAPRPPVAVPEPVRRSPATPRPTRFAGAGQRDHDHHDHHDGDRDRDRAKAYVGKYIIDASGVPDLEVSGRLWRMSIETEPAEGRMRVHMVFLRYHIHLDADVTAARTTVRVRAPASSDRPACDDVFALDELPLRFFYFYKYLWAVVAEVRRKCAVVDFSVGKRRGQLFADGRFEFSDPSADPADRAWFHQKCLELARGR
ncbi:uncharacterized protein V1510DRAFT_424125 [Dipodascopsis tothii]|uniref:uncharacterized protein n=1 Tax=Dipodascopsis tothii TaxID=44089 RepID=UPI0034CD0D64